MFSPYEVDFSALSCTVWWLMLQLIAVNLAPVANLDDFHDNLAIIHRVHNSVIACAYPKCTIPTRQFLARRGARIGR